MTDRWTSRRVFSPGRRARCAGRTGPIPLILAVLALLAPVRASAQCLLCSDSTGVSGTSLVGGLLPELPLRVDIVADLDFARIVAGNGGGSVTLDPRNGSGQSLGDVSPLGGYGFSGRVIVTGTPLRNVRITLPDSVTLTSTTGRTARVTSIQTGQSPVMRLSLLGRLEFAFGGRLELEGGADGDYRGRIPVTVSYE